jgi:lipid A 3-O-deacylase
VLKSGKMQRTISFAVSGIIAAAAGPTMAGEALLGVYDHDISDRVSFGGFEKGPQIIAGVRTASLDELAFAFKPRVHLIVGVNTRGGTNYAAAGLSWRFNFANDRFYLQPGIGAAVHTGKVNLPSPDEPGLSPAEQQRRLRDWQTKLDLGSRVLFEPEVSLGWKATDRFSFELSWVHLSHAQLAGKQNPGLGDFGLRAVYRYGIDR